VQKRKSRQIATANPEPFKQAREQGETKDTREQADKDIKKFNMLVVDETKKLPKNHNTSVKVGERCRI